MRVVRDRLVEIRNRDREPSIRQASETDEGWILPLFIGEIEGRWEVLR